MTNANSIIEMQNYNDEALKENLTITNEIDNSKLDIEFDDSDEDDEDNKPNENYDSNLTFLRRTKILFSMFLKKVILKNLTFTLSL